MKILTLILLFIIADLSPLSLNAELVSAIKILMNNNEEILIPVAQEALLQPDESGNLIAETEYEEFHMPLKDVLSFEKTEIEYDMPQEPEEPENPDVDEDAIIENIENIDSNFWKILDLNGVVIKKGFGVPDLMDLPSAGIYIINQGSYTYKYIKK